MNENKNHKRMLNISLSVMEAQAPVLKIMGDVLTNSTQATVLKIVNDVLTNSTQATVLKIVNDVLTNSTQVPVLKIMSDVLTNSSLSAMKMQVPMLKSIGDALTNISLPTMDTSTYFLKNIKGITEILDRQYLSGFKRYLSCIEDNIDFDEIKDSKDDVKKVIEVLKKDDVKEILNENSKSSFNSKQWIIFANIIWPLIISIAIEYFMSKPSVVADEIIYNTNYYVQVVNNHYTVNEGFDYAFLNNIDLRFINRGLVCVRVKPDNSSYAVAQLRLGKTVQVIDKYRKWTKIYWQEDGEYFSGWIQNWKLNEFK